jgi:serine/threonine protein kinase
VHRDIKPANILLEQGVERVAITDFGLARAIDDASLTRTGVLAGTPAYMSPEQARGETVDHRADLFSLGSVMYAMCAGRPPFRAESTVAVLKRICEEEPTPLAQLNADVPSWLARIVARLHAKDPVDRFATAAEVAELLQRCLAHVQNPSAVPLPAELAEPRPGWKDTWLTTRRLIAAGVLLASAVLAMLAQPFRDGASDDDPNGNTSTAQGANLDPSTGRTPREEVSDDKSRTVTMTDADYAMLEQKFQQGVIDDPETLYQWSLRLLHAEQDEKQVSPGESALDRHRQRMLRLEQLAAERSSPLHKAATEYFRLEAEAFVDQQTLPDEDF